MELRRLLNACMHLCRLRNPCMRIYRENSWNSRDFNAPRVTSVYACKINEIEQALDARYILVEQCRLDIKFKWKAHWKRAVGSWNRIMITIRRTSVRAMFSLWDYFILIYPEYLQRTSPDTTAWDLRLGSRAAPLFFSFSLLHIEEFIVAIKINDETVVSI